MFQGQSGRPLFWWVSYARASAEDAIRGVDVPRSWDQPHAGKFLIGYRHVAKWSVSLSGTAHTGWPTTPVTGELESKPGEEPEYEIILGERNSDRFDHYFRLDFKARRSFQLSRGRLWLTLDVANLTDRDNACCVDEFFFTPQPVGPAISNPKYDNWLGARPSFSVLWEF